MPLESGVAIGPYTVVSKLGAGGMGEVYRAVDVRLDRPLALKFLADHGRGPHAVERLRREARAASALNHPNICTIYEIGEADGVHFIAMELIEGQNLAERVARRPMALDDALPLAAEIADALQAAHARGIVHRDLKPANILITTTGHAKVLDFGLAKRTDTVSDVTEAALTGAGAVLGTVAYMSPEQARGETVDARSDIFSFGLVLFEMLSGRAAFTGNTTAVVFDAILNKEICLRCGTWRRRRRRRSIGFCRGWFPSLRPRGRSPARPPTNCATSSRRGSPARIDTSPPPRHPRSRSCRSRT